MKFKFLSILAILIFTNTSQATPERVCSSLTGMWQNSDFDRSDFYINKCFDIVSDHNFQEAAVKVCDNIGPDRFVDGRTKNVIECFQVIKNKDFRERDLDFCKNLKPTWRLGRAERVIRCLNEEAL